MLDLHIHQTLDLNVIMKINLVTINKSCFFYIYKVFSNRLDFIVFEYAFATEQLYLI